MAPLASRLTLLASVVCIVAAVAALYARSAVLDEERFADRAVAALAQDEVVAEIAQRFTKGVVERSPRLVTLRPAIETATESVVSGPAFAAEFGAGMRALHRDVFRGAGARPSLQIPGMAAQVQAALADRTPVLATRPLPDADPSLMSIGGSARERALLRVARSGRGLARAAPVVLALGLLGLLLVTLTAPDRRRGLWASGVALGAAGGALAVGWIAARTLTLEGFDTGWGDAVVNTIWGGYLDDLRVWSFGLAGAGIIVAAAARPEPLRPPAVPGALRGAGLLAAGGVLLADRDLAFDIAATTGAGVLLYLGACRLLAGRGRVAGAGAALAILSTAVVALATSRPPHTPPPAASPAVAVRASAAADRARASSGRAARTPRICFASMGDARVAAERAAIPEGAVVKRLADGRVCVRGR